MSDAKEFLAFMGLLVGGSIALMAVIALIWVPVAGVDEVRGESSYTGQVVDVEYEKGMLLQTTQLKVKTDRRSSSHETFCIRIPEDEQHVQTARRALEEGDRVEITYSRPLYVGVWECAQGTSIVQEIEISEDDSA